MQFVMIGNRFVNMARVNYVRTWENSTVVELYFSAPNENMAGLEVFCGDEAKAILAWLINNSRILEE